MFFFHNHDVVCHYVFINYVILLGSGCSNKEKQHAKKLKIIFYCDMKIHLLL